MLIALAAANGSFLEGADVCNACLYANLDNPIILEKPTNSSQTHAMPGPMHKLQKSLCGTEQAGEICISQYDKQLKKWEFKNSEYGHRIYFCTLYSDFILIAIAVDDLAFLQILLSCYMNSNPDFRLHSMFVCSEELRTS